MKKNRGNFAHDRLRASEAGKRGGQKSGGNFKHDPKRAQALGRRGGLARSRSDALQHKHEE